VKDRYTYRYDYNSNRLYRKNELASSLSELYRANDTSGAGTTHFDGYDGLNRLAAFHRGVLNAGGDGIASGLLGRSEAFGLDALGNWLTYGVDATGNGTNDLDQTRKHNAVNEIDTTDDHADAPGDAIAGGHLDRKGAVGGSGREAHFGAGFAVAPKCGTPAGEKLSCQFQVVGRKH
jgi:hypothetical protein